MVSLWPWRREDTSPASFEKSLVQVTEKITKTQIQLDTLHHRSRRLIALWTLYSSFIYLLVSIILALVVGWKNWGPIEYSVVAGSPVVMYLIRAGISSYYAYRIETLTGRIEENQTERAKTIEKLKEATKYNSTQQLLEKYGGASPSPKPKKPKNPSGPPGKGPKQQTQPQPQRTGIGPPATANIPRSQPISEPSTPQPIPLPMPPVMPFQRPSSANAGVMSISQPGPPEFAPNAFQTKAQYNTATDISMEGKWYDRILDVLLGEDETSPKNRIVLICEHCRLVNGQAPPGVKRLEDLGQWRCMACGAKNGKIDEGKQIVEEIVERAKAESQEQEKELATSSDKRLTVEEDFSQDEKAISTKEVESSE